MVVAEVQDTHGHIIPELRMVLEEILIPNRGELVPSVLPEVLVLAWVGSQAIFQHQLHPLDQQPVVPVAEV
jgi:hypothetical protein